MSQLSATASLELTLRVLGIGPGDEVIVPAYTYAATASPVCHVGATLVMVGQPQPDCYEMDYAQLEKAITPRTKAIIPVDVGGSCVITPVFFPSWKIAGETFHRHLLLQAQLGRIAVIADGAHSFGAVRGGIRSGAWADFTTFSFHAVKESHHRRGRQRSDLAQGSGSG
ncbi:MAG: DegT/DnrJ/EryC1/StrS family aminotransferase [Dysosmobacter welbionis]